MLTAIAIYVTLQGAQREYEATLGAMHDVLPGSLFEFMAGRASNWESPESSVRSIRCRRFRAPTSSTCAPAQAEPSPGGIGIGKDLAVRAARRPAPRRLAALVGAAAARGRRHARQQQLGGVGTRSATGSAIVANDMHLRLSVPNIWFRAAYKIPTTDAPARPAGWTG